MSRAIGPQATLSLEMATALTIVGETYESPSYQATTNAVHPGGFLLWGFDQ
jgi:hypothetical protein